MATLRNNLYLQVLQSKKLKANVSSLIVPNVPLWRRMLAVGEAVPAGQGADGNSLFFPLRVTVNLKQFKEIKVY